MTNWCQTYFMGSYLFEPHPPYGITHISTDPLAPNAVYNESNGWAYGSIDYIVFPMGLYVKDGVIYLCLGRHDREGWIVVLNETRYYASLKPIFSTVKHEVR